MEKIEGNFIQQSIEDWYQKNKRPLPWRESQNPYHIWLSEIILQQTRVAQGLPYYYRFLEAYPTIEQLAHAPENEVLRLWQGLGYYSRARNMQYTAKFICNELGGRFPQSYAELIKLKGIGAYTAAAIASFAYHEPVAVLDGNVYRVLARLWGISEPINSPAGQKLFKKLAQETALSPSSDYNQGIMEFGALHCTAQKPACQGCVLGQICVAKKEGLVAKLPVKLKKTSVKQRYLNYLVLEQNGRYYLQKRGGGDIWQGLFEPLLIETPGPAGIEQLLEAAEKEYSLCNFLMVGSSQLYKHKLTHQLLEVQFLTVSLPSSQHFGLADQWYDYHELLELPKPILVANYFQHTI